MDKNLKFDQKSQMFYLKIFAFFTSKFLLFYIKIFGKIHKNLKINLIINDEILQDLRQKSNFVLLLKIQNQIVRSMIHGLFYFTPNFGRCNFFSVWLVTSFFVPSCTTCTQPSSLSYSDLSAFPNIISIFFTIKI